MAKALAAKGFTVRLRVPAAPGYCHAFFDRQLDVRRATPTGLCLASSVRVSDLSPASVSPARRSRPPGATGSIWWPTSDSR